MKSNTSYSFPECIYQFLPELKKVIQCFEQKDETLKKRLFASCGTLGWMTKF